VHLRFPPGTGPCHALIVSAALHVAKSLRRLKEGMNRTKQLTIGMAAALVILSSALLTVGLIWLKQHISQETPAAENGLDSLTPEVLVATTPGFEALQPTPTVAIEAPNPSSEFAIVPTLNNEK